MEDVKIKVGDRVKLRNGFEDLIIAEVSVNSLQGYDFEISCDDMDTNIRYDFNKKQPFVSKKGSVYREDGTFRNCGCCESEYDVVEIIKEKKKVKKYLWVYKNQFDNEVKITTNFYSEEEGRIEGYIQKIESTMKEVEVNL